MYAILYIPDGTYLYTHDKEVSKQDENIFFFLQGETKNAPYSEGSFKIAKFSSKKQAQQIFSKRAWERKNHISGAFVRDAGITYILYDEQYRNLFEIVEVK